MIENFLNKTDNLTPDFAKNDGLKEDFTPDFAKNDGLKEDFTPDFAKNDGLKEDFTPDFAKSNDIKENNDIVGGAYKDIPRREGYQKHHMPADSVSPLESRYGPSISMTEEDHEETASYGNSKEAREYREAQKKLIDKGDFQGAFNMDVEDIRSKFGDKYDKEIQQAQDYIDTLKETGRI